ncbi:MAG: hypothetical protein HY554_05415 [Elusimicrobia bacterium]|nr:hypothetical protein [Elusimicrobiota bacterium]
MNVHSPLAALLLFATSVSAERGGANDPKVAELAGRYGVEEETVTGLRDRGLGWGEVDRALSFSERSGKPLTEVLRLRDGGMGWGRIARELGLHPSAARGKEPVRREAGGLRDAPGRRPGRTESKGRAGDRRGGGRKR